MEGRRNSKKREEQKEKETDSQTERQSLERPRHTCIHFGWERRRGI